MTTRKLLTVVSVKFCKSVGRGSPHLNLAATTRDAARCRCAIRREVASVVLRVTGGTPCGSVLISLQKEGSIGGPGFFKYVVQEVFEQVLQAEMDDVLRAQIGETTAGR